MFVITSYSIHYTKLYEETRALGPAKDKRYYFVWNEIERDIAASPVTGMDFTDAWKGMKLTIYDVRFVADTATIIPQERDRLDAIAGALKLAGKDARFLVEGHTASVGKPVITSYSIHYTKLYEIPKRRRSTRPTFQLD